MTITSWELYCMLKLDEIKVLSGTASLFSIIACIAIIIITFFTYIDSDSEDSTKMRKYLSKVFVVMLPICLFTTALNTLAPSTKQMAAIKVIPAIVNSKLSKKDFPEDLNKIYTMAKECMEEQLRTKRIK